MKKLVLGTVQFGLNYGISNKNGQPQPEDVFEILKFARRIGIETLDTAEDYGSAQELIGRYHTTQKVEEEFGIISKMSSKFDTYSLAEHVKRTLSVLEIRSLEAYLFHNFRMYKESPGLLNELVVMKNQGLMRKVGVSIYTNEELLEVIQDDRCDVIQIPYNLLDNSAQKGILLEKAKTAGKELHVRSVYLQGLFFMSPEQIPQNLVPLAPYLKKIAQIAKDLSVDMNTLALQYVHNNAYIDKILIGVDTVEQLACNMEGLKIPLDKSVFSEIDKILVKESRLLNPVNWK
ncbi:aldo/keto reductase [Chitinophaga qingshengii]|uniref:Aldo/keto reductase n=1 Tax=Chitinophaga qingshengii TaxID=1569794 RepID=A0ABR7TTJ6_9BACT|nr:aldo/keto reductase [Chitinophaga qingshengii]MBC9933799.1 aldo/keto reductase [Chitinophaga qingshengii]